jgi:hypothetical protein
MESAGHLYSGWLILQFVIPDIIHIFVNWRSFLRGKCLSLNREFAAG